MSSRHPAFALCQLIHVCPLFKTLQWLPVLFRVKTKVFTTASHMLPYLSGSLLGSPALIASIFPLIPSIPATPASSPFSNRPDPPAQQGLGPGCSLLCRSNPCPHFFHISVQFCFLMETFPGDGLQTRSSSHLAPLFPLAASFLSLAIISAWQNACLICSLPTPSTLM